MNFDLDDWNYLMSFIETNEFVKNIIFSNSPTSFVETWRYSIYYCRLYVPLDIDGSDVEYRSPRYKLVDGFFWSVRSTLCFVSLS